LPKTAGDVVFSHGEGRPPGATNPDRRGQTPGLLGHGMLFLDLSVMVDVPAGRESGGQNSGSETDIPVVLATRLSPTGR